MNDVVELAKERRAALAAEAARLDEFLVMAEALAEIERQEAAAGGPAVSPEVDEAPFMNDDALLLTLPRAEDDEELLLTGSVAEDEVELDTHVGRQIRHRRWMTGMTQEQLAQLVGITVGQVQRFETGDSRVSAGKLRDIAAAMEVPVSFFLEGSDGAAGGAKPEAQKPAATKSADGKPADSEPADSTPADSKSGGKSGSGKAGGGERDDLLADK